MTNLELKQIRLENGLKQSDIAELLGIKQSYVSDMEKGKKPISKNAADIITKKFGKTEVQNIDLGTNMTIEIAISIIKQQSDSLTIKDEQISRLISIIEMKSK
jgi:transcriptional regulator with XRE-family HTH domain